ncbi:cobalt-factor II C20-methyltransferase [Archaeoglobus sulfaticallidus PM70-1]|uniref:Cobalt-factor II C20-methyltransferase n=1 Tax=Archaeoglobus sulfaticallidus PM70-1 TaxID=387631 RepID=N0BEX3_9EURY|nr:cobalt-factor II C(20)-methyltransferase [Archaeoglobus sulfaticallidus]AGK62199.1 cobalt-factor II C20-methyltransferase [Archaeoglobus sulfaticallidus PM70-1]
MLYGVGLGPGDKKLLTLRAVEIIKEVDEVIVPGKMAYELIKDIREPRIVEFPMGKSEEVARSLAREISERDDDTAFCCIGDPIFYSTFHHIVEELLAINPEAEVEVIPGVSSINSALAKTRTFINNSMLLTTQDFFDVDVAVVLKAKRSKEVVEKLKERGFNEFILIERMFMDGEKVYESIPNRADYFSVLIAKK